MMFGLLDSGLLFTLLLVGVVADDAVISMGISKYIGDLNHVSNFMLQYTTLSTLRTTFCARAIFSSSSARLGRASPLMS